jgi:hypothetical protein
MKCHLVCAAGLAALFGIQAAQAQGPRMGYIGIEKIDPASRTVHFTSGFERPVDCAQGLAGLDPLVGSQKPPAFATEMIGAWGRANALAQNPPQDAAGILKVGTHMREVHGLTPEQLAYFYQICPNAPR